MKDHIHYKGFIGSVHFSEEDALFHGRVIGVRDLLSFEGESVAELIDDFHATIDEYLAFCERMGKEPEKPYKGSFNIRIQPDLHRQAAQTALARGISLNAFVESAIRNDIARDAEGR